jgi:hypothetical protein
MFWVIYRDIRKLRKDAWFGVVLLALGLGAYKSGALVALARIPGAKRWYPRTRNCHCMP